MFNRRFNPFPQIPFWAKVGEIPSSYKVAMSYEEQLLWLCHQIEMIKEGTPNYNYELLENKPSINGVTLTAGLTSNNLGLQDRLIAGDNISIINNVISATGGEGGTTNYNLLAHKPSINGVILEGDKSFNDLGLETTKVYTELTDYVEGYYFNLDYVFIGDNVGLPISNANSEYLVIPVSELPSNKVRITGYSSSSPYFTCENLPTTQPNPLTSLDSSGHGYSNEEISLVIPEEANYLVFNFTNTDETTPKVELISETIGGTSNYNNLINKPSINGVELIGDKSFEDLGFNVETSYNELTSYVDDYYYNLNIPSFIGDIVLAPVSQANTKCLILKISDLSSNKFRITGESSNYIWFTTNGNPYSLDIATITRLSTYDTGLSNEEITFEFNENEEYLVFNFTDTNETTPKVEEVIETIGGNPVKNLESNIVLGISALTIDTGFYNTANYLVLFSTTPDVRLIGSDEIFYFDKNRQVLWTPFESYKFDEGNNEWGIYQNEHIENSLTNDRTKIPTSYAVYQAIQNISPSGDTFYTELTSNLILEDDSTPDLEDGWYYCGNYHITLNSIPLTTENYFFFVKNYYNDNTYESTTINIFTNDNRIGYQNTLIYLLDYRISTGEWRKQTKKTTSDIWQNANGSDIPTITAIQNGIFYKKLTSNMTLNSDGSVTGDNETLTTGYYYLSGFSLSRYSGGSSTSEQDTYNSLVYYDTTSKYVFLIFNPSQNNLHYEIRYQNSNWVKLNYTNQQIINDVIVNHKFYTRLTSNVTLNADGTTSPELTEGYYYTGNYHISYVYGGNTITANELDNSLIYFIPYEVGVAPSGLLKRESSSNDDRYLNYELRYWDSFTEWRTNYKQIKSYVEGVADNTQVISTIPNTGNNNDVPSVSALRNYSATNYIGLNTTSSYTNTTANAYNVVNTLGLTTSSTTDISLSNGVITFNRKMKVTISENCNPQSYGNAGIRGLAVMKHINSTDTNEVLARMLSYSTSTSTGLNLGMSNIVAEFEENDTLSFKYYSEHSTTDVIDISRFSISIVELK